MRLTPPPEPRYARLTLPRGEGKRAEMKVALIQTRTPATHEAALAHVLPLVAEAAAGGARFIATPEGTNVLQKDRSVLMPLLRALPEDPVVQGLRAAAKEQGVWLL